MFKITWMKQQRKMILLIHNKKLLQLIHWPRMELPMLRIVMMFLQPWWCFIGIFLSSSNISIAHGIGKSQEGPHGQLML